MKANLIKEALKEAENGAFISQESMERWVDSLGTKRELPPPQPDVFHKKGTIQKKHLKH